MQVTPPQQQQIAEESPPASSASQANEFTDDALEDLKGNVPS